MSAISDAFNQYLLSQAYITYLVEDRIYPGIIPQEIKLPALSHTWRSAPGVTTHDGLSYPHSIVTITIRAETYEEIEGLKNRLMLVLDCKELNMPGINIYSHRFVSSQESYTNEFREPYNTLVFDFLHNAQ